MGYAFTRPDDTTLGIGIEGKSGISTVKQSFKTHIGSKYTKIKIPVNRKISLKGVWNY